MNALYPTDDTRLRTKTAKEAVERLYRRASDYSKAEVLLLDLCQPNEIRGDLFAAAQSVAREIVGNKRYLIPLRLFGIDSGSWASRPGAL